MWESVPEARNTVRHHIDKNCLRISLLWWWFHRKWCENRTSNCLNRKGTSQTLPKIKQKKPYQAFNLAKQHPQSMRGCCSCDGITFCGSFLVLFFFILVVGLSKMWRPQITNKFVFRSIWDQRQKLNKLFFVLSSLWQKYSEVIHHHCRSRTHTHFASFLAIKQRRTNECAFGEKVYLSRFAFNQKHKMSRNDICVMPRKQRNIRGHWQRRRRKQLSPMVLSWKNQLHCYTKP